MMCRYEGLYQTTITVALANLRKAVNLGSIIQATFRTRVTVQVENSSPQQYDRRVTSASGRPWADVTEVLIVGEDWGEVRGKE
jgi:hypothetical protein